MTGADDWVRDLVHPDDGVRWAALDRHQTAVRRALVRAHTRIDPTVTRSFDPALWAAYEVEPAGSAFGAFDLRAPERNTLFPEWESAYQEEWRSPDSYTASQHTRKCGILHRFTRRGFPAGLRHRVPELMLRARAADLLDADDPLTRLRAAFLLHLADHPPRRITRRTWRQWPADPDLAPLPVR
ncbi:hypothetical protein ACFFSW_24770 [Saccharothrix longispora]|uniref:Uncharacterized protein n=1 Tax=Saccharothrix longispora TaxID=33920 RepID=A0ABU1PXA6_9PSEU|nr:hypothetical protein [Saccharothrix longispora]MDR6595267.1 hypothetical protein [Saccharothrix longispora]